MRVFVYPSFPPGRVVTRAPGRGKGVAVVCSHLPPSPLLPEQSPMLNDDQPPRGWYIHQKIAPAGKPPHSLQVLNGNGTRKLEEPSVTGILKGWVIGQKANSNASIPSMPANTIYRLCPLFYNGKILKFPPERQERNVAGYYGTTLFVCAT